MADTVRFDAVSNRLDRTLGWAVIVIPEVRLSTWELELL